MAHKKGMSSKKNGRDSESKRLGAKRADGSFLQATFLLDKEEQRFILVTMLVSAAMIHCSH